MILIVVDCFALALLTFEVPSLLFSQYPANSVGSSEVVALSLLAYLAARLVVRTPLQAVWLSYFLGVSGVVFASMGILQFAAGARRLSQTDLTDLVSFRALMIHPISNWVSGEAFTALLLFLFFACAAAIYLWRSWFSSELSWVLALAVLPIIPILTVLLLSLSRAVFWSTFFFFFAACGLMAAYRVVSLRTGSFLLLGSGGALLLLLTCSTALYPGIFRAYAGRHVSQTRSTEGRLETWNRSLKLVHGHLAWGVGSSNAGLFLLASSDQEDTTGFVSRAFSLPIQLLVEKGLVGFGCYAAFLLCLTWEFHRGMRLQTPAMVTSATSSGKLKRKSIGRTNQYEQKRLHTENAHRAMKCVFAAGLAAVLLRELTYSSLLEHALTLSLAFMLAALMCAPARPDDRKIGPVAIGVAVVVVLFQWPYWRYSQANSKLSEFYSQVATANFAGAKDSIEEAIRLWPWNARLYGWRAYVDSQQLPSQCFGDRSNGGPGPSEQDKQTALAAAGNYHYALALNSRDAVAHHNLAWLEHLLGNNAAAARDWEESVNLDPGNAALHLSYGMFLAETGSGDAARAQYEAAIELTPSILDSPFFARYRAQSPQAASIARPTVRCDCYAWSAGI